ncbi:MAG: glycine zipper domain-containing protein [Thermodesulfobacteriota bacterium]
MNIKLGAAAVLLALTVGAGAGCATQAQTGAAAGAGIGALIGQAIGHNTAGTLIGTGVGAGLGYIIGNELDKKTVSQRREPSHAEVQPLAGSVWRVTSIVPRPAHPYREWKIHFRGDGTALNTKVEQSGQVTEVVERYRVVGATLILNQDDYVINARYRIEGNQLYMDTGEHSIVMQRIS